jgi:hypothetical protein
MEDDIMCQECGKEILYNEDGSFYYCDCGNYDGAGNEI